MCNIENWTSRKPLMYLKFLASGRLRRKEINEERKKERNRKIKT
jgi:hypothetical protein